MSSSNLFLASMNPTDEHLSRGFCWFPARQESTGNLIPSRNLTLLAMTSSLTAAGTTECSPYVGHSVPLLFRSQRRQRLLRKVLNHCAVVETGNSGRFSYDLFLDNERIYSFPIYSEIGVFLFWGFLILGFSNFGVFKFWGFLILGFSNFGVF